MEYRDQPRILRPGEDYSLWPSMKWTRAQQLANQLFYSIRLQSASSRAGLDVEISEDRLSATFLVREAAPMPIHEWSLLFGDILHNYRSALDALAWELAHLDGKKPHPSHSRKLYFPICLSKTEWDKKVKGSLASIPEDIRRRLYAVQPFHSSPVEKGIFVILHKLDIADKHKGQVKANVVIRDRSTFQYTFRLERNQEFVPLEGKPATEWLAGDSPVKVGQPVFKMNSGVPIEWAESQMALPLKLYVEHEGSEFEIFSLIENIEAQFEATFSIINTGRSPEQPDRAYELLEDGKP